MPYPTAIPRPVSTPHPAIFNRAKAAIFLKISFEILESFFGFSNFEC
jgi:hypothetical protein